MRETAETVAKNVWLVAISRVVSAAAFPIAAAFVGLIWGLHADMGSLKVATAALNERMARLEERFEKYTQNETIFRRTAEINDARQAEQIGNLQRALDRLEAAFGAWRKSQAGPVAEPPG